MVGRIAEIFGRRPVEVDLSHIKKELSRQGTWISKLHEYSKDIHNYTNYIKDSNAKHKKEILEHISNTSRWIDYLNTSHLEMKKEINDLKRDMRKTLRNDFQNYHEVLTEYINLKLIQEAQKKDVLKQEVLDDLKKELLVMKQNEDSKVFHAKKGPITEEILPTTIKSISHVSEERELSNPEKELLNLLFTEDKPLTYEMISSKLGKSLSSVRVYMNSLKSKNSMIEEFRTPNGSKIFSIKNSELVKTLFNAM